MIVRTIIVILLGVCAYGQQQDEVVRIKSDLVQTSVMVFDKHGRFVEGLRREQFELRVDGKPQPIAFFEEVIARSRGDENAKAGSPAGQGRSNQPRTPVDGGRTITFFVDDVHLSLGSLAQTRNTLLHFIDKEMNDDDLVAIASTSGSIGFLQQFTDDKAVLRAAVARLVYKAYNVRENTRESTPMTDYLALTIERKDDPRVMRFYIEDCLKKAGPRYPPSSCEVEVRNRARQILLEAAQIISHTYDSLRSLMQRSAELPGRKLVFFLSDGFLLDTGPRNADPRHKLNEIIDAAQRAGIVVYTIDARGLVSGSLDATNNVPFDPSGRLESALLREIPASQDALNALAVDTGGRALRNQNTFDSWIDKILDETSKHYVLAWRPETEDGAISRFRDVTVTVAGHPEYVARLPRGILTSASLRSAGNNAKPIETQANFSANALQDALGALYPKREISAWLSATYLDTPANGLVLTASLQIADSGLTFDLSDGKQTAVVDVAGVVLTDKGKQAGSFQTRLNVRATAADAKPPERADTIYNYRLPLAPGLYQVRVAALDTKSGHVGSAVRWIDIPDLRSGRLSLSSLLIGVQELIGPASGSKSQVQFSVDHRLRRDARLRFICFIYNMPRGPSEVVIYSEIRRDGRPILKTSQRRINTQSSDAARVPYGDEIALNSIPPGRYKLAVTVADLTKGTSSTQQTDLFVE